jgi:spore coat polysaccharide biosynthesis predicted glycosyltransferase SpsG
MKRRAVVAFRVAAGIETGLGHLSRCLSLAEALRAYADCCFISSDTTRTIEGLLRERGFSFHPLANEGYGEPELSETVVLLRALGAKLLIVDCPALPEAYLTHVRARLPAVKLMALDDCSLSRAVADAVVQPHIVARWKMRPHGPGAAKVYEGPDYFILRSTFDPFLRSVPRNARRRVRRVLVTMGGSDMAGLTVRVSEVVARALPEAGVDIICGPFFRHAEELIRVVARLGSRVSLHFNPPDIAAKMFGADLAVTAGGYSAYELAALGVPCIIVPLIEHQQETACAMQAAGCAISMESVGPFEERLLAERLQTMAADADLRSRMSRAGRRLVDGRGTERVCRLARALIESAE